MDSGTLLHEICHALGLFHEAQRPDRDLNLLVVEGNIASGMGGNFEKLRENEVDMPTPYDFSSIMQYRSDEFTKQTGDPTLIAPAGVVLGGNVLSRFDTRTLNFIADPFPGDPRAHGNFKLIRSATELIPLSKDRILHRVPFGQTFRVLSMNPEVTGHASPFGENPLTQGLWSSITAAHRLIRLDDKLMLDWAPSNGSFRVWKMELDARGTEDPLSADAVTHGHWSSIREGHELVALGGHRVLDWVPGDGSYRVWKHDPNASGTEDPFPELVRSGKWKSIDRTHVLIALGDGNVLDWEPLIGLYRIFAVNSDSEGGNEVFRHTPLAKGAWSGIRTGHVLISLAKHRILDWEPESGDFRLWSYHANFV